MDGDSSKQEVVFWFDEKSWMTAYMTPSKLEEFRTWLNLGRGNWSLVEMRDGTQQLINLQRVRNITLP